MRRDASRLCHQLTNSQENRSAVEKKEEGNKEICDSNNQTYRATRDSSQGCSASLASHIRDLGLYYINVGAARHVGLQSA